MNDNRRRFVAAYLGEAKRNATEAARIAGYKKPGQEGHRLLKIAEIKEAVGEVQAEINTTSKLTAARRLEILEDLTERHLRLIEARQYEKERDNIEGGDTGLLVRQRKQLGANTETVYAADTALTKELRELLKQTAIERGEWTEKHDQSGAVGITVRIEYADGDIDESAE